MKTEWLNDGNPFPAGHRKAGQYGLLIDFEDGRPEPQHVYAPTKDEMTTKIASMYGNTNVRLAEVKAAPATPAPAPAPNNPAAPAAAMTNDERMQAVADLGDPARAPEAIKKLLAAGGYNVEERMKVDANAAEKKRKSEEVAKFMQMVGDEWYGTQANADLLRDRTYARVGANFTAADLHESYIQLREMGVLQSESTQQEPTPKPTEEPSAPPPARPRVSTGARPSTLGVRPGTVPAVGQQLTKDYILSIAGTDEYERRLRDEPGFQAKVDAALR